MTFEEFAASGKDARQAKWFVVLAKMYVGGAVYDEDTDEVNMENSSVIFVITKPNLPQEIVQEDDVPDSWYDATWEEVLDTGEMLLAASGN